MKSSLNGRHRKSGMSPLSQSHRCQEQATSSSRKLTTNPLEKQSNFDEAYCESPTLKIEDCSSVLSQAQEDSEPFSPSFVSDLSQSPQRYSGSGFLLSSGPNSPDIMSTLQCPSSPLLTAVRSAVDSLSQYEDFEIREKIGAGFFAEVFKVEHVPTNQVMVLKVNKRLNGAKTMKEVELLKKLSHPNILHYIGACVHEGQLHPLTEYMNGGTLEQLIQDRSQDLPWSLRLSLALDVAKGMAYLHCNDMLHRDLNSKNCLLRKYGSNYTAVVGDFGLAAKAPHLIRRKMKRSQSVVGSPYWMAPEVLNGRPYDGKADVFSYGVLLCELISRRDADPDDIPRRRDYGLDADKFRALPDVVNGQCPEEFMELAILCCAIVPLERPPFSEVKTRLLVIIDLCSLSAEVEANDCSTLHEAQIPKRLSFHNQRSSQSPSPSPTFTLPAAAPPPPPASTACDVGSGGGGAEGGRTTARRRVSKETAV